MAVEGWLKSPLSADNLCCVVVRSYHQYVLLADSKFRRDAANNRLVEPAIQIVADTYDTWLDTLRKPVAAVVPGAPVVVKTEDGYELHSTNDDTVLAYTNEEWAAFLGGLDELRSDVLRAA